MSTPITAPQARPQPPTRRPSRLASLLYSGGVALAVAYAAGLHLVYWLAGAGAMHRDDWRHFFEWQDTGITTWYGRVLKPDLGHVFIYPLSLQEVGRAVWSSGEVFSITVGLTLSFVGFLVTTYWIARRSGLPRWQRVVLLLTIAGIWFVPLGFLPFWGFGSAGLMTTTGAVTALVLAGIIYGTRTGAANGRPAPPGIASQIGLFALCVVVATSSGGGLAVFPALFIAMFLMGARWRTIGLFVIGFVVLLVALKLGTGAPAASKGTLRPDSLLGFVAFPSGVLLNMLHKTAPFEPRWTDALLVGSGLAVASAVATGLALWQRLRRDAARPVLTVGLAIAGLGWALGLSIAIGRIDFGLDATVFPPRYGQLQMLIWLGLFVAYADIVASMAGAGDTVARPRAAVRIVPAVIWAVTAMWFTFAAVTLTHRLTYVFENMVGPGIRHGTLALLSDVHDERLKSQVFRYPALIDKVLPVLAEQKLELYSLPQAELIGTKLPAGENGKPLRGCRGALIEEKQIEDGKSVFLGGVIARPLRPRGVFTDTVAVVDEDGTVTGVGGFVAPLPPAASRMTGLLRQMPQHYRDLLALDRNLPRLINQDVYFSAFATAAARASASRLVYFRGRTPVCALPLAEPTSEPTD